MLLKRTLKLSIMAVVLMAVLTIPGQRVAAAGFTDQNSQEITEINPTTLTEENKNVSEIYSVLLTTGTDYKKSIPVTMNHAGKMLVNLEGIDVSKGVSVNLYSSEDCSNGSEIGFGTSLYEENSKKSQTWDITKAGTYYLCFETSEYASEYTPSVEQSVNFQTMLINSGGVLTSGKIAYGTTLGNNYAYYKVTAPKNGYFTIQVQDMEEDNYSFTINLCNSSKKFYNKNGEYISSSTPNNTVFAVKKGTYYIAVKTSNEAFAIKQTFKAGVDNGGSSKSKAVTIAKGKTKKGVFAITDSKTSADWYKFKITKSQKVDMIFVGSVTLDSIEIEAFSGSKSIGSKRLKGIDSDASFSIYTYGNNNKLQPGTYYIKVSKGGNTTANGYYSLKFN